MRCAGAGRHPRFFILQASLGCGLFISFLATPCAKAGRELAANDPTTSGAGGDESLPVPDATGTLPDDGMLLDSSDTLGSRLWQLPPKTETPQPAAAEPATATQNAATDAEARDAALRAGAPWKNPAVRTALNQATSNGDFFFDGLGGIPNPIGNGFATPEYRSEGIPLGWFTLRPAFGVGFIYSHFSGGSGTGASGSMNSGFSSSIPGINARSTQTNFGGESSTDAFASLTTTWNIALGKPELGRTLVLDYSGLLRLPASAGLEPYDQTLSLRGEWDFVKLKLGFGIDFSALSGISQDFGGEASRNLITLALTQSYQWTEKTSFDLDFTFPVRLFSGGNSSMGTTATFFVNYDFSPKTKVGVGVTGGLEEAETGGAVTSGSNGSQRQTYEQLRFRLEYLPSELLTLFADVGAELRQVDSMTSLNPTFDIGATWRVREGTSLRLSADSRVVNSAAEMSANYLTTTVTLAFLQRIGKILTGTVTLGYSRSIYESTSTDFAINRDDQYILCQAGLTATLAQHWSASLIASLTRGISGDEQQTFQTSLQINYAF